MLEEAVAYALEAHKGQLDQSGEPHFFHCFRVMDRVRVAGGSELAQLGAVLHDTIEDDEHTDFFKLQRLFGYKVADIVGAVSKEDGEPYMDFVHRSVTHSPEARLVKYCDVKDNYDRSNTPELKGLRDRGEKALRYMLEYVISEGLNDDLVLGS